MSDATPVPAANAGSGASQAAPSRAVEDERMRAGALVVASALAAVAVLALDGQAAVVPALHLAAVTPLLWRTDLREHRLPNRLVLPSLALALLAAVAAGTVGDWTPLLAGLATGAVLVALSLVGGLGMGDAKLGAALALLLGPLGAEAVTLALLLAVLAGGVAGLAGLLVRRVRRGQAIAFGPFLLAGAWAVLGMQALAVLR